MPSANSGIWPTKLICTSIERAVSAPKVTLLKFSEALCERVRFKARVVPSKRKTGISNLPTGLASMVAVTMRRPRSSSAALWPARARG